MPEETDTSKNEHTELLAKIAVVGVGGAGGNAINNMIHQGLTGVDFFAVNTDAQALSHMHTERRIQLGAGLTQGLGAGSKPETGRAAAEETFEEIKSQLDGYHMLFIAAGMGGGTGTGAAPVIARAARDLGILSVGVVTKPFLFEGAHRSRIADNGIEELERYVDTLIIIPNQNLFRIANEKTTFADAFKMADDVLYSGIRGVTDLMLMPGLINLDFADVRSVMSEMGKAMMGTGEAEGEQRALNAAEAAISNPLLGDTSMANANGVLINITGGADMSLFEVDEAANRIRSEVNEDTYIIFGSSFDDALEGRMRVSIVATGIDVKVNSALHPELEKTVAPAAMPSAFAEDAFIPPLPPVKTAGDEEHVDPMAEASLLNGSDSPEKPKGPSLFERVTGGAKSKVAMFGIKNKPDPDNTEDKTAPHIDEDDLLDVPAFLRRQGNGPEIEEPIDYEEPKLEHNKHSSDHTQLEHAPPSVVHDDEDEDEIEEKPFIKVPVYFATDREDTRSENVVKRFNGKKGEMSYGVLEVSIPKTHKLGQIETPIWWLPFQSKKSDKHVVLLNINKMGETSFFETLENRISRSDRKEAFIFVHGYNVSFEDAARRAGQIAYDLKFQGAPILYSWPSLGRLEGYLGDRDNALWTVPHLQEFLTKVANQSGAETIHIIAHSLGNQPLINAVREMVRLSPDTGSRWFNEIVLTAPDIDVDVFRQLAHDITKASNRVTLYTSENDVALKTSKSLSTHQRAGDSGQGIVIIPDIDTVDVSAADTSLMGHSYIGDNISVLSDIFNLFLGQKPDLRYGLVKAEHENNVYWRFHPR